MSPTEAHNRAPHRASDEMVAVDDIAAHLRVPPAPGEQPGSHQRAATAAAMAEVLTRHLDRGLRVDADGTVWCASALRVTRGFLDETGAPKRWSAHRWQEAIVEHVDLDAAERAGQAPLQGAAQRAPEAPGSPAGG